MADLRKLFGRDSHPTGLKTGMSLIGRTSAINANLLQIGYEILSS